MAENTETRIIKIEIDQTQALKDLEQTESALIDLKDQQKALNDSLKAGTITQQEYVASKVQLDQKIQQETANRKTLTQTINTESNSLAAQKLKLKDLITERDKIDRSTVEGAKKFDVMNGSINKLSGSIKEAEIQGGSFQRNVGNYKGTIDQFTGGAYSAAQGLMSMVKASLAFIATPIGAIIAAIGIALGSLMAYFKGSEEGQNRLNKIMIIGSTIMEKVMDIAEGLGSAIFDAFENPKQALMDLWDFVKNNLINRFTAFAVILEGITTLDFKKVANGVLQLGTGVEDVIGKVKKVAVSISDTFKEAVAQGTKLADFIAKIDRDERRLIVERAQTALEVSKLREEATFLEGDAKRAVIMEAIELESQLSDAEVAHSQTKLAQAKLELKANGADKDALMKVAEAQAAVLQATTARYDNTLKFNKQIAALDEEEAKRKQKILEEQDKANEQAEKKRVMYFNAARESIEEKRKEADAAAKKAMEDDAAAFEAAEDRKRKALLYGLELGQTTASQLSGILTGIAQLRMDELNAQLNAYKLQQSEELAAQKARLDAGEISEEQYKAEVIRINQEFEKKQDDIKRKAFEDNKKNQIAQARIDQAQIILGAIKSVIGVPLIGAILGAAAAAAQLIITEVQIGKIKDSQYSSGFSIGGYTGPGGVHDAAGLVHRGEVVWNQRDVAAVGGPMAANAMRPTYQGYAEGGIVASGMTNQIDSQFMGANPQMAPYLVLTELNQAQNSLAQKVQIVEA